MAEAYAKAYFERLNAQGNVADRIDVQFNPTELSMSKGAQIAEIVHHLQAALVVEAGQRDERVAAFGDRGRQRVLARDVRDRQRVDVGSPRAGRLTQAAHGRAHARCAKALPVRPRHRHR